MNYKITRCANDWIVTYYKDGQCLFSYRADKNLLHEQATYILDEVSALTSDAA